MRTSQEEGLLHKYRPLPEDGPRHKKRTRKAHVRSDHKHAYETVCVDSGDWVCARGERHHVYHTATRCSVCGRIGDVSMRDLREVPAGMPLYEVDAWTDLLAKTLPDERRVP